MDLQQYTITLKVNKGLAPFSYFIEPGCLSETIETCFLNLSYTVDAALNGRGVIELLPLACISLQYAGTEGMKIADSCPSSISYIATIKCDV